jgi:HTH-type transcriptional regulator/antitoxin HigA
MEAIKKMGNSTIIEKVVEVWPTISPIFLLPHTEDEYNRSVHLLNELIDEVGNDETHPIAAIMETLGALIYAYDSIHLPEMKSNPIDTIKYLIEEHGLKYDDLQDLGSVELVSKILDGQEELNLNHIKALSKRFNVSPMVFIE